MEKTLKRLFDFQKFEGNSELQQVIDSVHARYSARELDLSEMEYIAAAGVPMPEKTDRQKKQEQ